MSVENGGGEEIHVGNDVVESKSNESEGGPPDGTERLAKARSYGELRTKVQPQWSSYRILDTISRDEIEKKTARQTNQFAVHVSTDLLRAHTIAELLTAYCP